MYGSYLTTEVKKWVRDPMMFFMLVYPVLFGLLGRYLVPYIYESNNLDINAHADIILTVLALMIPLIFGALTAFSILDDRDDNILMAVKVTPLTIHQFLSFKVIIALIFAFVGTLFVLWFSDIGNLGLNNMLVVSLLASLSAPLTGFFINAFAKNKIEGFAVMKGFGMILIFPIVSLFFIDAKELIFAIAPGFWPAKAISALVRGEGIMLLSYRMYFWLGLLYAAAVNFIAYKLFIKKV